MSEMELKPCPFCRSDADMAHSNDRNYFYAFCGNDDCEIQPEGGLADTDILAASAWNTRPVEDALVRALERIADWSEAEGVEDARAIARVALQKAARA